MIIGNLLEELIEDSCLDSFFSLVSDMLSMIEDEIDPTTLDRTREDDGSIREKVELLPKIDHKTIQNGIRSDIFFLHDEIPFIHDDNDSLLRLESDTRYMEILMSHPLDRIDHESDDIRSLDRSLGSHDTPLLDIPMSDLSSSSNPCGIDEAELLSLMSDDRIDRISRRPWHILHDRSDLT